MSQIEEIPPAALQILPMTFDPETTDFWSQTDTWSKRLPELSLITWPRINIDLPRLQSFHRRLAEIQVTHSSLRQVFSSSYLSSAEDFNNQPAMEVHVRNVPQQGTEKGFQRFMRPHLVKLSIRAVHCQKARDKTFASLTFLYISDAQRFLEHHGQERLPRGELVKKESLVWSVWPIMAA